MENRDFKERKIISFSRLFYLFLGEHFKRDIIVGPLEIEAGQPDLQDNIFLDLVVNRDSAFIVLQ